MEQAIEQCYSEKMHSIPWMSHCELTFHVVPAVLRSCEQIVVDVFCDRLKPWDSLINGSTPECATSLPPPDVECGCHTSTPVGGSCNDIPRPAFLGVTTPAPAYVSSEPHRCNESKRFVVVCLRHLVLTLTLIAFRF